MYKYVYEGPVTAFGICVTNNWKGETMAESEAKAKSNLAYQFKKSTNRLAKAKVELPGKIVKIEGA